MNRIIKYGIIAVIALLTGCQSYKYVPTTKRAAKKAIEREIGKINYKEKRIAAIALSFPELADTTHNAQKVIVNTVVVHDTIPVEVKVEDTKKVTVLRKQVDSLLVLANAPPEIIEKIRKVLQPLTVYKDTTFTIIDKRLLAIGKDTLTIVTDIKLVLKNGNLAYTFKEHPVNTSIIVNNDKVTFNVKRLPGIIRWPLEVIGTIILLAIVGVIVYFGVKYGGRLVSKVIKP